MDEVTSNAPEPTAPDTPKEQHLPPPPVAIHLNTPSGALVEAILSQDLQEVNRILDSHPDLANSLLSHRGHLYKKWLHDQDGRAGCCPASRRESYEPPPMLVEPAVFFAATAYCWKDPSCFPRDIPAASVAIVRALIERGATLPRYLGDEELLSFDVLPFSQRYDWPKQAIWKACSRQDSPDILELLVRAGADPLGEAINWTGLSEMAIEMAVLKNADGSVAFLLDYAIAAHDKIDDYLDMLRLAAYMANEGVVDVFLRKGCLGMINRRLPPISYHNNPFYSQERPRNLHPTEPEHTVLMEVVHCDVFGYFGYHGSGLVRAWALPNNVRCRESLVHTLFDAGADATVRRIQDNATLIHGACRWAGPATLGRIISSSGCDIKKTFRHTPLYRTNPSYKPPLEFACGGDGVGYLHMAAKYFNTSGAQELIQGGIQPKEDASGRTALHWVSLSDEEYFNSSQEQKANEHGGHTSHLESGSSPAHQMAKYIVEIGVDIDAQDCWGRTALHYACRFKNVGLIVQLLSLNANCGLKDGEGNTALHALSQKGFLTEVLYVNNKNIDVVSELVRAFTRNQRFTPDEKNDIGETALIIACKMASIATVEVLLSLGCNPNIADKESWAPLHHILRWPCNECSQDVALTENWFRDDTRNLKLKTLLLEAGADESLANNEGQTYADLEAVEAVAIAEARQRGKEYMERSRQAGEEQERERRKRRLGGFGGHQGRGRGRPLPSAALAPEEPLPVSEAGHGRGKGH